MFGISVKINGKVVTIWYNDRKPKSEIYICCYNGVEIKTWLDRSKFYKRKVIYVETLSSKPKEMIKEMI